MKRLSIIVVTVLLTLGSVQQAFSAAPTLSSTDLPTWTIEKPDTYNDKQLFGYINGGAELYLEYGFKMVTAWNCKKSKQEFVVDVYEMVSPAAAFGIWSISRRNCTEVLPGAAWSCVTANQILYARGPYLVNITLYDRDNDTRQSARKAATILLKRIKGKDFALPKQYTSGPMARFRKDVRLFQGPLAVQGSLSEWSTWLEGIQRYDIYQANAGKGKQSTSVGLLRFRSPRDAEKFAAAAGFSGKAVRGKWGTTQDKSRAMKLLDASSLWFLEGGGDIGRLIKSL